MRWLSRLVTAAVVVATLAAAALWLRSRVPDRRVGQRFTTQYAGPAPVPLQVYNDSVRKQGQGRVTVTNRVMRQVLSQLVLSEHTFQRIGPAVNSGTSIFFYGPPGNGKTSVARAIGDGPPAKLVYPVCDLRRWTGHQNV